MRCVFIIILASLLTTQAFAADGSLVNAAETIPRGSLLTQADLILSNDANLNILDQYIGQETKRTIYSGTAIRMRDIQAPVIVRRNARVSMVYRFKGLQISSAGRAMSPGSEGEIIEILNLESRKRVEGRVSGPNQVEIQP